MITVGDVVSHVIAPGKRNIDTILRLPEFLGFQGTVDDAVRAMLPDMAAAGSAFGAPIEAASVGARRIDHPYPVLAVHGYSGSSDYMKPTMRSLVRDGYTVESLDALRGGIGDARIEGHRVAEHAMSLSRRNGGRPVILVGHSRGGMISVDAAVHHLKPGMVAAIEAAQSPLEGKHTLPGLPGGSFKDAIARKFAKNPIMDLFIPDGSMEQLLTGSEYVRSLKDPNPHVEYGAQLVSIFRDKSDGLVAPIDAHFTMPGWQNTPVDIPGKRGDFPHLDWMMRSDEFYERLVGDLNRASLREL